MLIRQYYPAFVDISDTEAEENSFSNSVDLLNISWIKKYSKDKDFYRFSLSRDKRHDHIIPQHNLIAEYENGYKWYVIGSIKDKDIIAINDLPDFRAKYRNPMSKTNLKGMMNVKAFCQQAGITYPTMRDFTSGKNRIKLSSFLCLLDDTQRKCVTIIIEQVQNKIKRQSGRKINKAVTFADSEYDIQKRIEELNSLQLKRVKNISIKDEEC